MKPFLQRQQSKDPLTSTASIARSITKLSLWRTVTSASRGTLGGVLGGCSSQDDEDGSESESSRVALPAAAMNTRGEVFGKCLCRLLMSSEELPPPPVFLSLLFDSCSVSRHEF